MFGARLAASSDKDVIAERVLERKTARGVRVVAVRISRPEEDERDPSVWSCRVEFLGFPRRARLLRYGMGVDQVQALLNALQLVHGELGTLRSAGEQLTWLADSDLGFPSLHEPPAAVRSRARPATGRPERPSTKRRPARR